jgi:hypothetical protein
LVGNTEGLKCRRENIKTDIEGRGEEAWIGFIWLGLGVVRGVVNTVTDIWVP